MKQISSRFFSKITPKHIGFLVVLLGTLPVFLISQNFTTNGLKVGWTTGYELFFADVTGDGKAELIGRNRANGQVLVFLTNGRALTGANFSGGTFPVNQFKIFFADVNGDGKSDLITWNLSTGRILARLSTGAAFGAAFAFGSLASGMPGVADAPLVYTGPESKYDIYFHDITGDRKADLVGRNMAGTINVWTSTGSGVSATRFILGTLDKSRYEIYFADINGDLKSDLIGWQDTGDMHLWLGRGTSSASATSLVKVSRDKFSISFADINADGKADLIRWDESTARITAHLSNGATFPGAALNFGNFRKGVHNIFTADINGDRKSDLIQWDLALGNVSVWLGTGQGLAATALGFGKFLSGALVFSDEFNGTELDRVKWATLFAWNGRTLSQHNELECYQDNAVSVSSGRVRFTATPGAMSCPTVQDGRLVNVPTQYKSGLISAHKVMAQTYGFFEIRAKVPQGQGLWSALWLQPQQGWPPEIDILENLGDEPSKAYMNVHWGTEQNRKDMSTFAMSSGASFSADYHTFAVDWRPGLIVWYIDGVEAKRVSGDIVSNVPMYLIANLAVGGDWPGNPADDRIFPAYMDVDYIRVLKFLEK